MNATSVSSFWEIFDTGYFTPQFNAALYFLTIIGTVVFFILYTFGVI